MQVYDYPLLLGASHLGGYKFLIDWSTGEQTIVDISPFMSRHKALLYRSEELIKDVHVDPAFLYWGDEDFIIMNDDIYEESFPYSAIVSSGMTTFLSMARVRDMSVFPHKRIASNLRVFVHGKDADRHKVPHVHIVYGQKDTRIVPLTLDGVPVSGVTPANPPFTGKLLKLLRQWVLSNQKAIITEWNKENPNNKLDIPTT
jgi:hypothetical protein